MIVAFYVFRLGLSALAFVLELSLAWLWSALIADYAAVRAMLKTWRFRGPTWRSIEV